VDAAIYHRSPVGEYDEMGLTEYIGRLMPSAIQQLVAEVGIDEAVDEMSAYIVLDPCSTKREQFVFLEEPEKERNKSVEPRI
jgi:hypothetical protein